MLLLASRSPRRQDLLNQIGVTHQAVPADVDEQQLRGESPPDYVRRITLAKARAGRAAQPTLPVLAADTAVIAGDRILGKPRDRDDAINMLLSLSDREHQVLTGVALITAEREIYRLSDNRVRMRALSRAEAEAYWQSGEPADKAGGYGIQGLGARFISHLSGSYSGVMGLPLFETAQILEQARIISTTTKDAKLTV